jgi:galactokinase
VSAPLLPVSYLYSLSLAFDQCVAMGSGSIGLMTFDVQGCQLRVLSNREPLYFVVADLKAAKDTVVILRSLQRCFPFPSDSIQSRMHRYASNNQKLCWAAVTAIELGNPAALGSVMMDAQQAFNQCAIENCREQLMAPRLREVMNNAALRKVSLAIKGTVRVMW